VPLRYLFSSPEFTALDAATQFSTADFDLFDFHPMPAAPPIDRLRDL
jgi:hypothetical protein